MKKNKEEALKKYPRPKKEERNRTINYLHQPKLL